MERLILGSGFLFLGFFVLIYTSRVCRMTRPDRGAPKVLTAEK